MDESTDGRTDGKILVENFPSQNFFGRKIFRSNIFLVNFYQLTEPVNVASTIVDANFCLQFQKFCPDGKFLEMLFNQNRKKIDRQIRHEPSDAEGRAAGG